MADVVIVGEHDGWSVEKERTRPGRASRWFCSFQRVQCSEPAEE